MDRIGVGIYSLNSMLKGNHILAKSIRLHYSRSLEL